MADARGAILRSAAQNPPEGSFAWFLANGRDPYTGDELKPGDEVRGPKRSSKRPEAKSAPKSGGKSKGDFVVNYHPPKIGQGPSRAAGAISINADAIGPAVRNAAESAKRALTPASNSGLSAMLRALSKVFTAQTGKAAPDA